MFIDLVDGESVAFGNGEHAQCQKGLVATHFGQWAGGGGLMVQASNILINCYLL